VAEILSLVNSGGHDCNGREDYSEENRSGRGSLSRKEGSDRQSSPACGIANALGPLDEFLFTIIVRDAHAAQIAQIGIQLPTLAGG
jgi:hypothetical protein